MLTTPCRRDEVSGEFQSGRGSHAPPLPSWGTTLIVLAILLGSWAPAAAQQADAPPALTPQQQARLKERDRDSKESNRLQRAGKLPEAVAAAQAMLAIDVEVRGHDSLNVATALNRVADLQEQLDDFAAAQKDRAEALAITAKLLGGDHWKAIDARLALAHCQRVSQLSADQRRQLAEAAQLQAKAKTLSEQSKYQDALLPAQKAFELRKAILGTDDPLTASSAHELGYLYNHSGDFTQAKVWNQTAADLRKQLLGPQHPAYATTLSNLAYSCLRNRDFAQAESLLEQALDIRKSVLGERDPEYLAALNSLAGVYSKALQFRKAEAIYRQVLAIRKATLGENHSDYATTLSKLAELYVETGDYAQAEPLYRQALAIRKAALGEQSPAVAESLNALANLARENGDNSQAEQLGLQALAIRKTALGERNPAVAESLASLAYFYTWNCEFAKAEPMFRQALEIRKQSDGERSAGYASVLTGLAFLHQVTGDYAKAELYYSQALQIRKEVLGEKHPAYSTSLQQLGVVYRVQGKYAEAERALTQALEIRKEVLGEKHPWYAKSLDCLASLYKSTGDYARAEKLVRQARQIRHEAVGDKNQDYATYTDRLGMLLFLSGDYAGAEPLFQQALAIRKEVLGETHIEYAYTLNNLACLDYATGDFAQAETLSAQALQIMRKQMDLSSDVQSERQQLLMVNEFRYYLNHYLSIAAEANVSAEQIYAQVLAWKGTVSRRQQAMGRVRQLLLTQHDPQLSQLFDDLVSASRELANQALAVPQAGMEKQHQQKLGELNDQVERLQQELAAKSHEFREQVAPERCTPDDLRSALPADAALVDLLEYKHLARPTELDSKPVSELCLVAFVVRPTQGIVRIELGPTAQVAAAVEAWRAQLSPGVRAPEHDAGADLRQLVWDKLLPQLTGAKMVLISPDGATARFPWAALPGKEPGSYLIEDVGLAVVPIPRMLPEMLATAPAASAADKEPAIEPSLLLLGDVDFNADPGRPPAEMLAQASPAARSGDLLKWPSLPGTRTEMAAIADSFEQRFPDAKLSKLRGERATKGALAAKLGAYRYVHLATHGFFAPPELKSALTPGARSADDTEDQAASIQDIAGFQPGLLSGLVLAGANLPTVEGKDDGILTALEVSQLDLSIVELATLSACETGLGKSAGGEGLLGLQRAFQISGAKSVMATLWTVSDDASRALMIDFYDNLWNKKLSKLEALRQAQLKMLREGIQRGVVRDDLPATAKPRRLPPYYWAPFVLSGDWR